MDSRTRSFNFELPREIHFDKFMQQALENSSKLTAAASSNQAPIYASTPTITTFDVLTNNEFLQKLGASILSSIQLKHKIESATQTLDHAADASMDLGLTPNRVLIDSSSFNAMDELHKQVEYDKFMNKVWIGIVFTLILISIGFCICSCFLYHQFRTWKRNYHNSNSSPDYHINEDVESLKLPNDMEDPVPNYTLASGLPNYEAAMELLHKTPQSCLIVYPSVFNVFNKQLSMATATVAGPIPRTAIAQQLEHQHLHDITMPLLAKSAAATPTSESVKQQFTPPWVSPDRAIRVKTTDEKPAATTITITTIPIAAGTATKTRPLSIGIQDRHP